MKYTYYCNHKRCDTLNSMNTIQKKQNGFTVVEILIAVAVLGIIGFVGWRAIESQQQNSKTSSQLNNQAMLPESLAGIKSLDEIIALATPEIASRQMLAIELIQEDEGLVYSINLSDNSVLVFDAKTGDKIQLKSPDAAETNDNTPLPAGYKPAVTFEAAIQTAKAQRPGQDVEKVKLELEDGIVVYSVRFSDKSRVDVDATTGSVLRIRESGKPEVKLQDDTNDIDNDGQQNSQDMDDDNDGVKDTSDSDNENDGVDNSVDSDDDNDGTDDTQDEDSSDSEDSDNSGSGR